MPHDAWRQLLPYVIDTYKNGIATIDNEILTVWNRLTPAALCNGGQTTVNTASQEQIEYKPEFTVKDSIFFSALLGSFADFTVTINGDDISAAQADWLSVPDGGIGIYYGSYPFYPGLSGVVEVKLSREGTYFLSALGGESKYFMKNIGYTMLANYIPSHDQLYW